MTNHINMEERLSTLVTYFLSAISRCQTTVALEGLKEKVLGMTVDEFECIYNSLLPEEQIAFTPDMEFTAEQEMSQFMIFTKALNRFWDAKNGHTWMGEDGVLCVTENSSFIELPISLNSYMELSQAKAYSIKDMRERVAAKFLSENTLLDVSAAVVRFMDDPTIKLQEVR